MRTLDVVVAGIDMQVDFDYISARPGIYSGPWEDSYPDEPEEISIIEVRCPYLTDKDGKPEYVDLLGVLNDATLSDIEDQISNAYNDMEPDYG